MLGSRQNKCPLARRACILSSSPSLKLCGFLRSRPAGDLGVSGVPSPELRLALRQSPNPAARSGPAPRGDFSLCLCPRVAGSGWGSCACRTILELGPPWGPRRAAPEPQGETEAGAAQRLAAGSGAW